MKESAIIFLLAFIGSLQVLSQGIIVNHTCTNISEIPESAIVTAKETLHIAYGHTSHGSQLTEGMTSLVGFMNDNGYTTDLYAWQHGGSPQALDLHDCAMAGDVGYYPDWVNNTRTYLGAVNPETGRGTGSHANVNVIIWSWCGQISSKYAQGLLDSEYLEPMQQLEEEYFGITFVYMTGHLDHWDDANNKGANQAIRNFCEANNRVLFDFADIESFNPDGTFFEFANDDCDFYASGNGERLGNWAVEWQDTHAEGVDWFDCYAAHSEPLNGNLKASAAWWLWARIAGWDPSQTGISTPETETNPLLVYPNPSKGVFTVETQSSLVVRVLDMVGRVVTTKNLNYQNRTIDLSQQPDGIYFFQTIGNGARTVRVVKQ